MSIKIQLTTAGGTVDISQLIQTATWSGDYKQCARTLDFGLLSSPTDQSIPTVSCPLGSGFVLLEDNKELFNGFVFTRTKSTDGSVIDITCFDRGIYVKKNTASYKFQNVTPEGIAKRICADYGIKPGAITETGVKISRNFIGASLYQIIQTAYTLASQTTGELYQIRFEGDALTVIKKGINGDKVVIAGGSNLMTASTTETIADMINQVQIVDKNGNVISTVKNTEFIGLYGLLHDQIKQIEGEDTNAKARKLLADNGITQKITLNNLGDSSCLTGSAVVVQEPYTGLYGLFYIDSDTHTWKNGLYLNKLVVNFRRIMDEQEAGELIK